MIDPVKVEVTISVKVDGELMDEQVISTNAIKGADLRDPFNWRDAFFSRIRGAAQETIDNIVRNLEIEAE